MHRAPAIYVSPSMEAYELPADTPDTFALTLCEQCALALAGHTSADTGDPATDEAAEWMEDQWGYPYAAEFTAATPDPCGTATCDGCGTSEAGRRHPAIANRIG
ncbi:hypothetical protein [Brachybacterium sp. UNK5269]|uniref:hypothetical protein n=1 Tax=Brachybacterium sp. UNK5269 TaxID=3408576 RepID=UPI003BAECBB8